MFTVTAIEALLFEKPKVYSATAAVYGLSIKQLWYCVYFCSLTLI